MNVRGIKVTHNLLLSLHKELLEQLSEHYTIKTKTLTVFQLYGFGSYDEKRPNLKTFIAERTGQWINGKYLYNKIREIEKGSSKDIRLRRDYLSLLILAAGYDNYTEYLNNSPYISEETKKEEVDNYKESTPDEDTQYYIGYYVEDKQYFIKSKFTINKMKTASWEILYWEKDHIPTFYTYFGKCVPTGESALSFYFSKENSSLNKECFINIFYGNKMQSKPILLGAYCGFGRHNNPVVGKMIFEQVDNEEMQDEMVRSKEINPVYYHYLYSERLEVESILPHTESDLSISSNKFEILNFLTSDYLGFYLDKNNYLIPISYKIGNDIGELTLRVSNTNYRGIGRISSSDNYLISDFNEKNKTFSQFSLQIQPLETALFLGHILVYSGANVLNGRVLLWRENDKLKKFMNKNKNFYIDKNDLDINFRRKVTQYLEINKSSSNLDS